MASNICVNNNIGSGISDANNSSGPCANICDGIYDDNINDDNSNDNDPFDDTPIVPQISKYIDVGDVHDFFCPMPNSLSDFSLVHINSRSLRANFNEICNLLHVFDSPIDVIAISETWLSDSENTPYSIKGYNFICNCRQDRTGGGVGLYIADSIVYIKRPDLTRMFPYLESIFIESTNSKKQKIILGCIYRPPSTDLSLFNKELSNIVDIIEAGKAKLSVIAGDFNLDLLKVKNHPPTQEFLNSLLSHSYLPAISHPTRLSEFSSTLIDNIFICGDTINLTSSIIFSDISDHLPIAVRINSCAKRYERSPRGTARRFFDDKSLSEFIDDLSNDLIWSDLYILASGSNPDANVTYSCFYDIF